jgi:hypothetical protein
MEKNEVNHVTLTPSQDLRSKANASQLRQLNAKKSGTEYPIKRSASCTWPAFDDHFLGLDWGAAMGANGDRVEQVPTARMLM